MTDKLETFFFTIFTTSWICICVYAATTTQAWDKGATILSSFTAGLFFGGIAVAFGIVMLWEWFHLEVQS
jgi:hypothetical protein